MGSANPSMKVDGFGRIHRTHANATTAIITLPGALKISGLTFSKNENNLLYVTDNTKTPTCYKVTVWTEQSEEEKNKKDIKDK